MWSKVSEYPLILKPVSPEDITSVAFSYSRRSRSARSFIELTAQLELSQHAVEQQAGLAAEKERDAVKRVQAAREEEWARLNQVETDK